MICLEADKNNNNLHCRMMARFKRMLNDCALKELYLSGCRYTWSNERERPTLERLDRMFATADWQEMHGVCFLHGLSTAHSDHAPLLLKCSPPVWLRKRFHFELF